MLTVSILSVEKNPAYTCNIIVIIVRLTEKWQKGHRDFTSMFHEPVSSHVKNLHIARTRMESVIPKMWKLASVCYC